MIQHQPDRRQRTTDRRQDWQLRLLYDELLETILNLEVSKSAALRPVLIAVANYIRTNFVRKP